MDKKFLIILGVVLVALFGLFFFTGNKKDNNTTGTGSESSTVSNHSKGGNSKNVELLVYGDFQCPVCSEFFVIENAIFEKYKDQIKFTYRHYPLDTIHPNARAAHRAAEAAGLQNKFFEMHDLLYQNQKVWSDSSNPKTIFEAYAEQLGLDINKFKADYESQIVNSTINADKNEGTGKGVQGTPTYFINGKKLDNKDLSSVDDFSKIIDQYLNQ
jgi:protein-disulfide isomerase